LATFQDADGDTKIQLEESADEDKIRFDTAGSERMIITNAGKVGIGTSDPSQLLNVQSATFPVVEVANYSDSNPTDGAALDLIEKQPSYASATNTFGQTGVYGYRIKLNGSDNTLRIKSGSQTTVTDRITLTRDAGELGIGTTTPNSYAFNDPAKLVVANTSGNSTISLVSGTSSKGYLAFADGTSGTARYPGSVQYDHSSNYLSLHTNDGTEAVRFTSGGALSKTRTSVGTILGHNIEWNGSNYSNIDTGYGSKFIQIASNAVYFRRTASGSGNQSASYDMTIDASGNFMVGQTSMNYNVVGGSIASNGLIRGASEGQVTAFNRKGSDGTITVFYKDGVSVGSISTNANSLPSDRNFKRDISDLNLGLDLVNKLKPSQFCYKISDEDSPIMYGLIAQDLEESLTEVGIEKNSTWLLQHEPKDDENQSDYSLDYTKLIPILINSVQELSAKVEELEGKIE